MVAAESCDTNRCEIPLKIRTAIVVFRLFLQMVLGQHFGAGDVVSFLCRVALGA